MGFRVLCFRGCPFHDGGNSDEQSIVPLSTVPACDSKTSVKEWIDSVVDAKRTASGQEKMCMSKGISELADVTAECHTHGCLCRVPEDATLERVWGGS